MVWLLGGMLAHAQTVNDALSNPNTPLQRLLDPSFEQRQRLDLQGPDATEVPTPPPPPAIEAQPVEEQPIEGGMPKILLQTLRIEGVTRFEQKELEPLFQDLIGQVVSVADLNQLTDRLTRLYQEKGYITSMAYIPSQRFENGSILVQVVEGTVSDVEVNNNRFVSDRFLTHRLYQQPGEVFNVHELEKDILQFNRNQTLFDEVRAKLKPGKDFGTSVVELEVKDRRPYHLNLSSDNTGRRLIGFYRHAATFTHDNLLGVGDSLLLNAGLSGNGDTVFTESEYKLPLHRWGWSVGVGHSYSHVRLGREFEDLNITNGSHQFKVFTEMPLYKSDRLTVTTDAGLRFLDSRTLVDGTPDYELTGANSHDSVRATTLGVTLDQSDPTGRTYFRGEMENGVGWLGGNQKYLRFWVDGTRIQGLKWGTAIILRGQGQFTPQHLSSLVQYQLGGAYSVRGYPEGAMIGDQGYLFSAELRFPFWGAPAFVQNHAQGVLFVDHGGVFLNDDSDSPAGPGRHRLITSYGVGLRTRLSRFLTGRLDVGITHDWTPSPHSNNLRIHYSVQSQLF